VATSSGDFLMNGVPVRGTATLNDASTLETRATASQVVLSGGARLVISPDSKARVMPGRVTLERGGVEVSSAVDVEAAGMRVSSSTGGKAMIRLSGPGVMQVGALAGNMQVRNSAGLLLAKVAAGSALEFEPQVTGPTLPSTFVGCLLRKDGKYVVYDQTTRMVVELRSQGIDLAAELGNRIQASGTARTGPNNTQALDVTTVTRIEAGGCEEVAAMIGADTPGRPAPAPKPTKGSAKATKAPKADTAKPTTSAPKTTANKPGMSAGTKVAIVAAVGGGGAVAAVLATQSGKGDNRSR
jgi:hypothetical protein